MKPCPICGSSPAGNERVLNGIALLSCRACSFVFADLADERIEEANRTVFETAATGIYGARQNRLDELWFERVTARLTARTRPGCVLDVGCGNGLLLRRFLARGWTAHGVDFASWAEPFARRHGFELHRGALESLGLPAGRFDVVTSTSTLEHIARPGEHLLEILRILRPGGVAYLGGIPNYGSLSVRLGFSAFAHNQPPLHVNYFTRRSLARLLATAPIASSIRAARVATYGVPEVHALMERVGRWRRGTVGRPEGATTTGARGPTSIPSARRRLSFVRDVILTGAVAGHYYAGRPFGWGDKLEAVIHKQA